MSGDLGHVICITPILGLISKLGSHDYLCRCVSGKHLGWISTGWADSSKHMLQQLVWGCNNPARSKLYNPAENIVFNQIHNADSSGICLIGFCHWLGSHKLQCKDVGLQSTRMIEGIIIATRWTTRKVSVYWSCDWQIMRLADNMRPGASRNIKLWWNGNFLSTTCHGIHAYVSFNLHWYSIGLLPIKPVTYWYYCIDLWRPRSDKIRLCVPIAEPYKSEMFKLKM